MDRLSAYWPIAIGLGWKRNHFADTQESRWPAYGSGKKEIKPLVINVGRDILRVGHRCKQAGRWIALPAFEVNEAMRFHKKVVCQEICTVWLLCCNCQGTLYDLPLRERQWELYAPSAKNGHGNCVRGHFGLVCRICLYGSGILLVDTFFYSKDHSVQ